MKNILKITFMFAVMTQTILAYTPDEIITAYTHMANEVRNQLSIATQEGYEGPLVAPSLPEEIAAIKTTALMQIFGRAVEYEMHKEMSDQEKRDLTVSETDPINLFSPIILSNDGVAYTQDECETLKEALIALTQAKSEEWGISMNSMHEAFQGQDPVVNEMSGLV